MAFTDLHEHVQGAFAEFMGYDELDDQLTIWCYRQAAAADRVKAWRLANPERARASQRERNRRWRERNGPRKQKPRTDRKAYQRAYYERNKARLIAAVEARRDVKPENECARCKSDRVHGHTLCDAHLEWERERGRRNYAKRQEARAA